MARLSPVAFVAFDALQVGGRDVMGEPWEDRRKRLEDLFAWRHATTPARRGTRFTKSRLSRLTGVRVCPYADASSVPGHFLANQEGFMQIPWLKPAVWGVIGGAVASMIVGFSWLGWVLGSTAERMAVQRADSAVIVALTPTCVAKFMQQPNAATKLVEFRKVDSWKQRQFVEDGGWATVGGAKDPNSGLANACAEELLKAKT